MMRVLAVLLALSVSACATTVSRLDGEIPLPLGGAQNACEQEEWLVVAPTRSERVRKGKLPSVPRDDGIGVYRVGSRTPEDLTERDDLFEDSELKASHEAGVGKHDRDRNIAIGLGVASAVAIAVGTVLFIQSFGSETRNNSTGQPEEKQVIDSGLLAAGGITVGAGFALGVGGLWVAPTAKERARADSWRYTFLPGRDDLEKAKRSVTAHNARVRERCGGARVTPGEDSTPAAEQAEGGEGVPAGSATPASSAAPASPAP